MPTMIKELPSKEWLHEHYCVIDDYVCWKEKVISRGRQSVRAGKRVTNIIDDCGYVRVTLKGESYAASRVIYQMTYGDLTPEFEVDHIDKNKENNNILNLRKVPQGVNKRNKPAQRNQGTKDTGVCLNKKRHPKPHDHKVTHYYVARWYDMDGVLQVKHFNVDKLGADEAYSLACAYRLAMIAELNAQGAGYTDTHGK